MSEKTAAKKKAKKEKRTSFFKGVKGEFKKISWPSRETTVKDTIVVVVISLILCGFIRLIDVLAQLAVGAVSSIF